HHKVEAVVLQKVLSEQHAPLVALRPDTPPALAAVIERALAKDPADRWPDARAMREALEGAPARA
ncbi:MAG: hypothetical protein MUC69_10970, partial [Gemmatimonadales bacterium]|nr:hypothetical protein [Gemmatimonadales bacterium]